MCGGEHPKVRSMDPLESSAVPAVDVAEGEGTIELGEVLGLLRSERHIYQVSGDAGQIHKDGRVAQG